LNCDRLRKLTAFGASDQKLAIRKVELIGNGLESVGAIAEEFRNLHTLEISKNSVEDFEGIQRLCRLEKLYANENKMKEFPKALCGLENLKELSLCEN
jgi:Leucine-rich repeat (LRR) protein